ncbi:hypothetical protein Ppa06_34760 [Planomonospora parontospora subsp. parontospora]|uniref:Uncharacterized protein n=2 Tax=Planomonospora parontospora TaxID=58119 RepID=A0AA37BHC6_9ACTN|nr:hypothetical protein [Planomonospora parontospora]GGK71425.1 hypothetical protein GCM10010126_33690 [Planomonospora parontospora]GII09678.1 hypothetical protein Ppa06_34760 [Planomonospora parontospora subsp. parontospora]
MKRVIKTAVAVAALGLAAAICTPAQAQSIPSLGGQDATETVSMAIRGLAGGLTGGRLDGLAGGQGLDGLTGGQGLEGLAGGQGAPPVTDGVFGKASAAVERLLGVPAEQLTQGGAPLRGVTGEAGPLAGTTDSAGHLVGATNGLTHSGARSVENVQGTVEGAEGLTHQRPRVEGLVDGLNQAVPQGAERAGTVAPLVGGLAPAEAGPLVGAVEPVTRSASIDELSPLLGNRSAQSGEAAAGTLDSVTGVVRGVTENLTR